MKNSTAKRLFIALGILLFLLLMVGLLSACEPLPPIVDERCMEHTDYSFYQIEKDTAFGTSTDQWILETPHGTIEVSDKTYEGAMNYEYSEICYERADAVATTYSYTKKSDSIRPEPEIVIEIQEVEKIVEVEVYTHYQLEEFAFSFDLPTTTVVSDDAFWLVYPITNGNRVIPGEPDDIVLENFITGDLIVWTIYYDSNIIADDEYWTASVAHYRGGIPLHVYTTEEMWLPTLENSLEDFMAAAPLLVHLDGAYRLFYPEVTDE